MILVEIFEIRKNNLISFKMKKIINIIYMYIVLDFFFEVRIKLLQKVIVIFFSIWWVENKILKYLKNLILLFFSVIFVNFLFVYFLVRLYFVNSISLEIFICLMIFEVCL